LDLAINPLQQHCLLVPVLVAGYWPTFDQSQPAMTLLRRCRGTMKFVMPRVDADRPLCCRVLSLAAS